MQISLNPNQYISYLFVTYFFSYSVPCQSLSQRFLLIFSHQRIILWYHTWSYRYWLQRSLVEELKVFWLLNSNLPSKRITKTVNLLISFLAVSEWTHPSYLTDDFQSLERVVDRRCPQRALVLLLCGLSGEGDLILSISENYVRLTEDLKIISSCPWEVIGSLSLKVGELFRSSMIDFSCSFSSSLLLVISAVVYRRLCAFEYWFGATRFTYWVEKLCFPLLLYSDFFSYN